MASLEPELEPQWQPIEFLPVFVTMIQGMLESSQEQYDSLLPARDRPQILDDHTIQRILKLFTEQNGFQPLWSQQFDLWEGLNLSSLQRHTITQLRHKAQQLKKLTDKIIALAKEIEPHTIDRVLALDDIELAAQFLQESADIENMAATFKEVTGRIQVMEMQYRQYCGMLQKIFDDEMPQIPLELFKECIEKLCIQPYHMQDIGFQSILRDYCIYSPSANHKSIMAGYMDQHSSNLNDAELILLNVFQRAQFTVLEIKSPLVGDMAVAVYDLLEEEYKILLDEGLMDFVEVGDLLLCYIMADKEFIFSGEGSIIVNKGSPQQEDILQAVEEIKGQVPSPSNPEIATHILKLVFQGE